MTSNPFRWPFRAQCLAGAAVCAALLAFAFYSQLAWGLEPCELCVYQRFAYLALGTAFLVAGVVAPRSGGARVGLGGLAAVLALAGASIAGRQVWIKLFPPPMPVCNFRFGAMDREPTLWEKFSTPTVECGAVEWSFLGLSMPAWSLLWFALLALLAVAAALNRRGPARR